MSVLAEKFFDGIEHKDIFLYTISNDHGMQAQITNYGAILVSLMVPDKNGKFDDVVLGCDNLGSYYENTTYLGATIGRHANRIEAAAFEINGVLYDLEKNDNNNHLHGGSEGFHRAIWDVEAEGKEKVNSITLSYLSKDGEQNYPGNLKVSVTYSITEDNALKIEYYAVSDKDTVVNLTNHTYFNLAGKESNDILDHQLKIYADCFTPVDEACIPTGEIRQVFGTPFDFTQMKPIKPDIFSNDPQIVNGKGFDHNWVLNAKGDISQKAVEVFEPLSGRKMEVYTTKPGMQFYSGNCMKDAEVGKYGVCYKKRSGFCLESQYFPNSLKHKHFPSPILKAGSEYRHTTIYKFV